MENTRQGTNSGEWVGLTDWLTWEKNRGIGDPTVEPPPWKDGWDSTPIQKFWFLLFLKGKINGYDWVLLFCNNTPAFGELAFFRRSGSWGFYGNYRLILLFNIYILANSTCIKFCRFWVPFSSTLKIDVYLNLIIKRYYERARHQLKLYFKTIFFLSLISKKSFFI